MNLGSRLALMSDVHGEHRILRKVLERCRSDEVDHIVLLGDLFDRVDHAEACADCLLEWDVTGVLGNHERDALRQAQREGTNVNGSLGMLLGFLNDELIIDEAIFVHDEFGWKPQDTNGHGQVQRWLTFAGHTHFRSARDDNGPIDISSGIMRLNVKRRYLINPGAVVEGQFAVWDRSESLVRFHRV